MDKYSIKLPLFEGPLDLLLHLIKKDEVDIYDIPIAKVAEQYLEYIDLMEVLNLELAGEFLVMAATLAQIKSRMLLPPAVGEDGEEEGADPRAELVKRLVEYKKFKEAALELGERESVWREVFVRDGKGAWEDGEEPVQETLFNFGIIDLLDAFKRVITSLPPSRYHEVMGEDISITDKITQILDRLEGVEGISFESLFDGARTRAQVIVTFLALLELARIRAVRIMQVEEFGSIWLMKAVTDDGAL
ncbi:MAG: segregation/condensation protein A [Nitrospirae bacterium]|nr:segregation/condensation protein A [Nitrospirota bacterium]